MAWLKVEFYKRKQTWRGGDLDHFVDAIRISPAEGLYCSCLFP